SGVWVDLIDEAGRTRRLEAPELEYAYRSSRLQREPRWLVLQAELRLVPGDPSAIRRRVDEALQYRNRTQPLHLPSAGSVFKNPPGHAAGRLIEEAGCTGLRRGGAQVTGQPANRIAKTGGAKADDVTGSEISEPSANRLRVYEALQYRNRTQPLHLPSAGSVFKTPPGHAAGRLIEEAGCKVLRRGGAQVSEQHANWIVNTGGATAEDVLGL